MTSVGDCTIEGTVEITLSGGWYVSVRCPDGTDHVPISYRPKYALTDTYQCTNCRELLNPVFEEEIVQWMSLHPVVIEELPW